MQRHGIPQGCTTSSLLCDLYLSHVQAAALAPALAHTASHTHLPQAVEAQKPDPHCMRHREGPDSTDRGAPQTLADADDLNTGRAIAPPPPGRCAATAQHASVREAASTCVCSSCGTARGARSTEHGGERHLRPLLMHMADDFLLLTHVPAVASRVARACVEELPRHGVAVSTGAQSPPLPALWAQHSFHGLTICERSLCRKPWYRWCTSWKSQHDSPAAELLLLQRISDQSG